MPETTEALEVPKPKETPLIFISHDSRDAELAEAFSKLLRSVSAGMLKPFRSSDKKGNEGIEFGDEWYKTLMLKLDKATDVVCLLTERSLGRPWILYEAGVAKGKLGTPVHGLALGIPLSSVSVGPFYQFQNSDDSEDSLTKLALQICRRVPDLAPDDDVVASQVKVFKASVSDLLKTMGTQKKPERRETADEATVAKVLEEMKVMVRELSMQSERRSIELAEHFRSRRSSLRRLHPMMVGDMAQMLWQRPNDPVGILFLASFVREDFPWLYELGLEAYRAVRRGNRDSSREALARFRDAAEFALHGPLAKEMGLEGREMERLRELPGAIHYYLKFLPEVTIRKRSLTGSTTTSNENGTS